MKFEVIPYEQTPLTTKIKDIPKFIEEHKDEIEAFKEYAIERIDGIGLAANQCSLDGERFNLRMAAIKTIRSHDCRIAIDPKIVKYQGDNKLIEEGCLTWKDRVILADRFYSVDVEFYTPDGKFHEETHTGFQGQVWQHEINHINGVEENIKEKDFRLNRVGRNDDCPCGSGKKLKKCCINKI